MVLRTISLGKYTAVNRTMVAIPTIHLITKIVIKTKNPCDTNVAAYLRGNYQGYIAGGPFGLPEFMHPELDTRRIILMDFAEDLLNSEQFKSLDIEFINRTDRHIEFEVFVTEKMKGG